MRGLSGGARVGAFMARGGMRAGTVAAVARTVLVAATAATAVGAVGDAYGEFRLCRDFYERGDGEGMLACATPTAKPPVPKRSTSTSHRSSSSSSFACCAAGGGFARAAP